MAKAKGIHAHDTLKLGLRAPKRAPALKLGEVLTGTVPEHPATGDHFRQLTFGLYGNDRFGVCGPTAVANLIRLVSGGLTGTEVEPAQTDVFDLYRRSGNPNFDPATGEGDNGVDMQTMLEALAAGGIGDGRGGRVLPVCFASVNPKDEGEVDAAASICGGTLWGVTLENAQQAQSDARPPVWDYATPHTAWGGHAVLNGKWSEPGGLDGVISWAMEIESTAKFRGRQLDEAWVVIWPWNLAHPAFQEGIDLAKLTEAYKELTGRDLPVPGPAPTPGPTGDADTQLWSAVGSWAENHRHYGATREVSAALNAWAKAKGLA